MHSLAPDIVADILKKLLLTKEARPRVAEKVLKLAEKALREKLNSVPISYRLVAIPLSKIFSVCAIYNAKMKAV